MYMKQWKRNDRNVSQAAEPVYGNLLQTPEADHESWLQASIENGKAENKTDDGKIGSENSYFRHWNDENYAMPPMLHSESANTGYYEHAQNSAPLLTTNGIFPPDSGISDWQSVSHPALDSVIEDVSDIEDELVQQKTTFADELIELTSPVVSPVISETKISLKDYKKKRKLETAT